MIIIKDLVYFIVNYIVAYLPSRKIRMFVYSSITKGNISAKSSIGIGVRILDIRNVYIGENSNINFGCILDGRGAEIKLGRNVDVAPQVNIWTMQHNVLSATHDSESLPVEIEDGAWIANRAIILPGVHISTNSVVGAGVVLKSNVEPGAIYVGQKPRKLLKVRNLSENFRLTKLRRFR